MNASELKYHVENAGHESHFFTRSTMRFFGDTMANYGVRSTEIQTHGEIDSETQKYTVVTVSVWELYRKRPVKHGNQSSAYFDKVSYRRVFEVGGD